MPVSTSVRLQVKQEINNFIAFNRGMKEAHDLEKKKAQEMDVVLLKEYQAKLEQQERDRQMYLKRISDRQARQYAMADRVHQSLQDLATADEEKAKREQEALERRQMEDELRRKEKKKEEQRKVKEVVAKQIEEKEEAKRKAQEEAQRLKEEVSTTACSACDVDLFHGLGPVHAPVPVHPRRYLWRRFRANALM